MLNIGTLNGATDDRLATFAYSNALTDTDGTASTATLQTGGSVAGGGLALGADTPGTIAADVDKLRLRMAAAIGIIETKINEIINKSKLSC